MRIGRPAPGYASAADVSVKTILPHPGRMRRVLLLNPLGAVGGAVRRSPFGAGEQRVLLPFSRWKKVVAAAACTKGSWFWPRGQTAYKKRAF